MDADPATHRDGGPIEAEFRDALSRLPVGQRRPVVAELTAARMTTRAIARVMGVDQSRIVRDLQATDAERISSEPRVTHGLDGKTRTYPARAPPVGHDGRHDMRRVRHTPARP